MVTKVGSIAGRVYYFTMLLLLATIGLGAAFIVLSLDSHFMEWQVRNCEAVGPAPATGPGVFLFVLDMDVDIGWREFTITHLAEGADIVGGCFGDLQVGQSYPIADYQNNSAGAAGLGMVVSWGLGLIVALYTLGAMFSARRGQRRGGVPLKTLTKWCCLFEVGVVVATTVFWWLVVGKFGKRQQSLAPRLFQLVQDGANQCSGEPIAPECRAITWTINSPGYALAMGVAAMFAFGTAVVLLSFVAGRVDHLNSGEEELEAGMGGTPTKQAVRGTVVAEKHHDQPEEKARAKDRRSAKTGVRAGGPGGRAPSNTIQGDADGPDPMTYALEEGDEEYGSVDDDEEEVVYQNHQVHHSVINHSHPNPTQTVDDSRKQQQYQRGYSRGTSGGSYSKEAGRSFEEGSEFSDAASAHYYAQRQGTGGQSFMSSSSKGESFDEYR